MLVMLMPVNIMFVVSVVIIVMLVLNLNDHALRQ